MLEDEAVSGADMAPLLPDSKPLEPQNSKRPELKVEQGDSILAAALNEAERASSSAAAKPLELKVERADFMRAPVPPKEPEKASAPKPPSLFKRALRFGVRTVGVACLCGLAFAAGAYYSQRHSLPEFLKPSQAAEVPQNADNVALAGAVRQMGDDIRALKTSVEALNAAQAAGAQNIRSPEVAAGQPEAAQTATGAAIAELSGRVGRLEADSSTKLSQMNEQLASIERHMAAARAPAAARPAPPHKREHPHDAFDPSRDPGAPGAPRPLGAH